MDKKTYMELVNKELSAIKAIIEAKNADYTGGSDDAFANFNVTAQLGLSDARTGVLIRMVDKIQRVKSFIIKGELKVKDESATDAVRDIIGYSLILLGMLKGEVSAKESPKGFVVEVGKRYIRRDGFVTAEMVDSKHANRLTWPLFDPFSGVSYTETGQFTPGKSSTNFDLVSEYKEE